MDTAVSTKEELKKDKFGYFPGCADWAWWDDEIVENAKNKIN